LTQVTLSLATKRQQGIDAVGVENDWISLLSEEECQAQDQRMQEATQ
jgi:hypothetical protein